MKLYKISYTGTSKDDRDYIRTRMVIKSEIIKSNNEEKVKQYAKKDYLK